MNKNIIIILPSYLNTILTRPPHKYAYRIISIFFSSDGGPALVDQIRNRSCTEAGLPTTIDVGILGDDGIQKDTPIILDYENCVCSAT